MPWYFGPQTFEMWIKVEHHMGSCRHCLNLKTENSAVLRYTGISHFYIVSYPCGVLVTIFMLSYSVIWKHFKIFFQKIPKKCFLVTNDNANIVITLVSEEFILSGLQRQFPTMCVFISDISWIISTNVAAAPLKTIYFSSSFLSICFTVIHSFHDVFTWKVGHKQI